MPSDLPRRAAFLLGLGVVAAGPTVLATNIAAAAAAFGPAYPWRFLTWGRRENPVNASFFPRRRIPAAFNPAPLTEALDLARIERAFAKTDQRRKGAPLPLKAFLEQTQTTALLIAHDDRLLIEHYANGAAQSTLLTSRSMAKSVLALLTAFAIEEHRIPSIDTPLETLLPDIPGLRQSGVQLRHLLQMGAGLAFRGDAAPLGPFTAEPLWSGTRIAYFTAELRRYLATARPGAPPGTSFLYDDRSAQLVGLALERAFATPVTQALATRLWTPLGAEYPAEWALNGDADGLEKMEGGLFAAARDWLKLGQLVLHDGAGLLPPAAIRAITAPIEPLPPGYYDHAAEFRQYPGEFYGQLWWGFPRANAPPDSFMHGLYGQVVYICRKHRMVIVRTGITEGGVDHWPSLLRAFADELAHP